ncbi:hypothetical protein D3C73_1658240 [compost metagenome]
MIGAVFNEEIPFPGYQVIELVRLVVVMGLGLHRFLVLHSFHPNQSVARASRSFRSHIRTSFP